MCTTLTKTAPTATTLRTLVTLRILENQSYNCYPIISKILIGMYAAEMAANKKCCLQSYGRSKAAIIASPKSSERFNNNMKDIIRSKGFDCQVLYHEAVECYETKKLTQLKKIIGSHKEKIRLMIVVTDCNAADKIHGTIADYVFDTKDINSQQLEDNSMLCLHCSIYNETVSEEKESIIVPTKFFVPQKIII